MPRFILYLLVLTTLVTAQSFEPVNPNASKEAKALLACLYENYSEKTLSGQHYPSNKIVLFKPCIDSLTGKNPVIWGTDFVYLFGSNPGQIMVDSIKQKYANGYTIALIWRVGRPMDTAPCKWPQHVQAEVSDEEWMEFTTPGTALHERWLVQVDEIAGYLKQLRDANIPILRRPYHEMNGVWFCWGDKKGPDGYATLWQVMNDRFVNHHQLHNLLWVWNANAPRHIPFDEAFPYHHYYPGSEYVDVLTTDFYHFDYETNEYEQLLELADGKLTALGEVGEVSKTNILEIQPKWYLFMGWASWIQHTHKSRRAHQVFSHEQVLSKKDITLPYE